MLLDVNACGRVTSVDVGRILAGKHNTMYYS